MDMELRRNVRDPFGPSDFGKKLFRNEFVMSFEDAKIIAELLKTKLKVLRNRYDRIQGIFEAGEATDAQTTDLETVKDILGCVNEFLATVNRI